MAPHSKLGKLLETLLGNVDAFKGSISEEVVMSLGVCVLKGILELHLFTSTVPILAAMT